MMLLYSSLSTRFQCSNGTTITSKLTVSVVSLALKCAYCSVYHERQGRELHMNEGNGNYQVTANGGMEK